LIRVFILADTPEHARSLAELLSEEERIEILHAGTLATSMNADLHFVHVVLAAGINAEQLPDVPTVLLSDLADAAPPGKHVRAKLHTNVSAAELVAAIMAASTDLIVLTQAQAQRWLEGNQGRPAPSDVSLESLTGRESQVLRMLGDGLGNKQIAAQLGISDHTVKFHVAQILAKLGAGSRAEAVAIGMRRGLIPV
jgi:DNA-binding NarL/FixJ family response regulator